MKKLVTKLEAWATKRPRDAAVTIVALAIGWGCAALAFILK